MNNNLPWVEKYRPSTLNDIISHKENINTLTNLIENKRLPHMIFYGPPGTGKTTTILACAKKIYGSKYNFMILELNGSDDRGINVVREQIKNFSATNTLLSNLLFSDKKMKKTNIKLVILDEADAMTYDAQFALRRVIELYTDTTRFCLICNYITKIIPALQSRCQMFRFAPIKYSEHLNKVLTVIQEEKMNITNDAVEIVVELSEGDMRKSLNLLQSLNMSYTDDKLIDKKIVYQTIGYPTEEDRMMIIDSLKGLNLIETYNRLNQIGLDGNLSNQDIIREIINYYSKCDNDKKVSHVKQKKLIKLFDELAKIEINLSNGANNNIQLLAISAAVYDYGR